MIVSVHQPQYLPWLGFFDKIIKSDCFVFLDTVQYKHREFQNRNKIRTKNGWIWLIVPVIYKGRSRQGFAEVEIDNSTDWQNSHLRSLQVNYGKAPFFEKYREFLEEVYQKTQWKKLIDLNVYITQFLLRELGITTPVYFESKIGASSTSTERIIEICRKLNADIYLSGQGGKAYLEEEKFKAQGIRLEYQDFKHPGYNQCFSDGSEDFLPFMSIIDLLFNEGRERSGKILREVNSG